MQTEKTCRLGSRRSQDGMKKVAKESVSQGYEIMSPKGERVGAGLSNLEMSGICKTKGKRNCTYSSRYMSHGCTVNNCYYTWTLELND